MPDILEAAGRKTAMADMLALRKMFRGPDMMACIIGQFARPEELRVLP